MAWLLEVAQGGTLQAHAGASLFSPSEPAMATAGVLWTRRGGSRPLALSLVGYSAAWGQEPLFWVAGWHLCLLEGVSVAQRGSGWALLVEAGGGGLLSSSSSCCSRAAAALQALQKDGVTSGCYFRLPPPCSPLGRKLCLPARLPPRPSGAAETTGGVCVSGWQDTCAVAPCRKEGGQLAPEMPIWPSLGVGEPPSRKGSKEEMTWLPPKLWGSIF